MSVVVLGGGGKLGRLLRQRWRSPVDWTTRTDVDISDAKALKRRLAQARVVFCLAGATPGGSAPMETNVDVAKRVLDAAHGAHVFLFSSAAVYGDLPGPLTEDGPASAQSVYADAKLRMEAMAHAHPNRCTVLRLGNVAGADAILGGWRPGFQLDVLADGRTPLRSYIGPSRLARALEALALLRDLPAVLNLAAPGAVHMGALLDAAGLAWQPRIAGPQTIASVQMDTTRLQALVPFDPKDSTAQGIVADWGSRGKL